MFPTGINPNLVRAGGNLSSEQITEMLRVGRVLDVEVISVFGERAILSLGRNLRIEVTLKTPLKEGEKAQVQVQPRSDGQAHGSDVRPPVILKLVSAGTAHEGLIYVRTQSGPVPTSGPGLPAATLPQSPSQAGQPALSWIPIQLPQGGQAWAQIYVQEEGRKQKGSEAHHQVKIWWETPGVGPVQVTMDAAETTLTALFTVVAPESRQPLEQALPSLQERLNLIGFTDTRLGTRQAMHNEIVGPVRLDELSRLDRRA